MGAPEETAAAHGHSATSWLEPAALTLDERGMIRDCTRAGEELFGYTRLELTWQPVSKLLPQLSRINLVQDGQLNPMLSFLCHCGHLFEVQCRNGVTLLGELSFVNLAHPGKFTLRLIIRPSAAAA